MFLSFTQYPAYSRLGIEKVVFKHFTLHPYHLILEILRVELLNSMLRFVLLPKRKKCKNLEAADLMLYDEVAKNPYSEVIS